MKKTCFDHSLKYVVCTRVNLFLRVRLLNTVSFVCDRCNNQNNLVTREMPRTTQRVQHALWQSVCSTSFVDLLFVFFSRFRLRLSSLVFGGNGSINSSVLFFGSAVFLFACSFFSYLRAEMGQFFLFLRSKRYCTYNILWKNVAPCGTYLDAKLSLLIPLCLRTVNVPDWQHGLGVYLANSRRGTDKTEITNLPNSGRSLRGHCSC